MSGKRGEETGGKEEKKNHEAKEENDVEGNRCKRTRQMLSKMNVPDIL